MSRARVAMIVVGIVVVGGAVAAWWLGRGDSPPPLSVDDVGADADEREGSPDLDGTWEVEPGGDSTAGLRIEERRFGGLGDHTAVGRTTEVNGTVTVEDSQAVDARFSVDLASLTFTDDPGIAVAGRSDYLRSRALETDRFPTATFELTEPIDASMIDGGELRSTAAGELTLHGVARARSFEVELRRSDSGFVLGTAAPVEVTLADHNIEAPRLTGVSEVADTGEFEFVVVLRRR